MMIPKILVITATLGNRATLDTTIASVKSIGRKFVKHVIVAPSDKIPQLKEKFPELEIIAEPEGKKGIYPAINHGFFLYGKDYEYLTFINDDDYWLPEYKKLIEAIIKDYFDFVYGKTKYIDNNGDFIGEQTSSGCFEDFIPLLYSNIVQLTQQATIVRSELFFQLNGFDENLRLAADTKFWAMLSMKEIRYHYINDYCAAYMIQDGQLSSDHNMQVLEHRKIISELPLVSMKSIKIAKLKYRLANWYVYLKRICSFASLTNPFMRDN